ncbi:MAG: DUF6468 domain-containing protein [Pseudomonadota bacterium]
MDVTSIFSLSVIADLGLAGLLVAVIVLALRLDNRLKAVRDNSGELKSLIKGLNDATERAHQAVAQMSAAGREHKATLGGSIAKARELSDELTLITQSADSLASRLSGAPSAPPPADLEASGDPKTASPREEREDLRQLLAGIR